MCLMNGGDFDMIGERIQYLREEKKLTQEELAKALKMSKSSLASYEQNARKPSVDTVIELAKFFNVTSDYILELTNKPIDLKTILNKEKSICIIPPTIFSSEIAVKEFELIKDYLVYKYKK